MKKNNQWQKPDISVTAQSKRNTGTDRRAKALNGLGVPPAPARTVYAKGVPPTPSTLI